MKRTPIFAALAISIFALGCGAPDASAGAPLQAASAIDESRPPAPDGVLGTIRATIEGEPVELYVVTGEIRGEPYAGAAWSGTDYARVFLGISGLDTPTPDLDSFEPGAGGSPASWGSYEGPVLSLLVELAGEPQPLAMNLPTDGNTSAVFYLSKPTQEDLTAMYVMASGTLEVAEVSLTGELMTVIGTFSGTVRSMGSGETIEITEGSFAVADIPRRDEFGPGG
jgi:hypothetical protein